MIYILVNLFIKDNSNVKSPSVRLAYGVLCGSVGIGLNILLFLCKFLAGVISNSIAITADAFNNLSDAGSSFITLIGFKLSGQKPDPDHPFGHGRMEYLSGLLVALAIIMMGVELVKMSFSKILQPADTVFNPLVVIILIISILVKLYMAYYNRAVGKKIDSAAMMATSTDSLSDTLSTAVVLIATLISHFTSLQIDGYCGVLVGLFIIYAGFNAAKDTIDPLLGQPPEKEFVEKIESIIMGYDLITGIHDLIVHDYGPGRVMISVHAEVPADGDLLEIHDVIDTIEHDLKEQLLCEAVIHMDPIMKNNSEVNHLKAYLIDMINDLDNTLKFHDFRIVKGNTHTNVLFDIVVPYHFSKSDEELNTYFQTCFSELEGNFITVINIDKSYV